MPDIMSAQQRSHLMSKIRGKNTKPELVLRKALHRRGYRYRLHHATLPGKPDIVLPRFRAVIFVSGCFWHGHDCELFRLPATRREFWQKKIEGNRKRDDIVRDGILALGWRHLTVWECAIRGKHALGVDETIRRVCVWLDGRRRTALIAGRSAACH